MKKLLSIILFSPAILINITFAQPSITWQRSYDNGTIGNNEGRDICPSSIGTYFLVGYTYSHPQIVMINDKGDSLWSKFYPTINFWPTRCVSADNGSCIIVGERGGNGRAKIDADGNILWNIPNDTLPCALYGLIKTSNNNFIACGTSGTPYIGYVLKFDSLGQVVWDKKYHSFGQMVLYSITEAYNGGYLVCGFETDGGFYEQGIVIRTDTSGNEIWRKYPSLDPLTTSCNTIRKFKGKYLVVAGNHDTTSVFKLDTNGSNIYSKLIPPPSGTYSSRASEIRGEVYKNSEVILYRNQSSMTSSFTTIARLDSDFNQLSFTRIDYPNGSNILTGCISLINGDILFAGLINPLSNTDFYAVRTDSTLNSPLISIHQISNEIPTSNRLVNNYPNPFNPTTKIKFDVAKNSFVSLKIYDILGREVAALVNKELNAGTYRVIFDARNMASGIYIYTLKVNNFSVSKKMVYLA